MFRTLLLFIGLPALELMLLIELGQRIGTLATIGLIVVTGAIGAAMARRQGLSVLGEIQRELQAGRMPTGQWVDGALILLAAALLVTPGVLTDAFGFMCLVPAARTRFKRVLTERFRRSVAEGRLKVNVYGDESFRREEKNITPRDSQESELPREGRQ